jgi:hypothetical protein
VALGVEETGVEVIVETRSRAHGEDLIAHVREAGYPATDLL